MCTIAILVGVTDLPVVIAANRDELYARDTRPPQVLAPGVVGGLDAQSGGTWLAVNRAGRFAAVTNQRALAQPVVGVRSRGLVVSELAASEDPDAYAAALDPRSYASMNLVWGDAERVRVGYLRHEGTKDIITLERGIHVLANDRIGTDGFPRAVRLARDLGALVAEAPKLEDYVIRMQPLLADHTRLPLTEVKATHLPVEIERELTATCIHSDHYGTRSSTIVALAAESIDRGRVAAYLHADGPPCVTPYTSKLELLS
jgi:uncharacterized protein with NRDE domain